MTHLFRFFLSLSAFLFVTLGLTSKLKIDSEVKEAVLSKGSKKEIVLLGASIGSAWNISLLPERINNFDYVFEYIDGGSFDKSDKLKEIISRKENKPDAIFIKECAAYFPGDLELYKSLMKQWIRECQKENVIPIPTTVVPVTRLHSIKKFLIDIVKRRNPLKYGNPFKNKRNEEILEFNDWIRMYCEKIGLSVLDLEAAVRYSEENRFLREDLAKVDGLHLNKNAYKNLDQIVLPTLKTVYWENKRGNKEIKDKGP